MGEIKNICIECREHDTTMECNDDGHFIKICHGCNHVGGPYVSSISPPDKPQKVANSPVSQEESEDEGVSTLSEWISS